jgi:iron(III) transport system substrate-binding protein
VFAWNTDLVEAGEVPRDWDDLLGPANAGCALDSQAADVIAALLTTRGPEATAAWLEGFVSAGGVTMEPRSAVPSALASGELACGAEVFVHWVERLRVDGAPVDWTTLDPAPMTTVSVSVLAEAPHPHAAMLLAHWLLGKEAAAIIAASERVPVWSDVPLALEGLRPFNDPDHAIADDLLLLSPELMLELQEQIWALSDAYLRRLQD